MSVHVDTSPVDEFVGLWRLLTDPVWPELVVVVFDSDIEGVSLETTKVVLNDSFECSKKLYPVLAEKLRVWETAHLS